MLTIRENEMLAPHTTFRTGGPARYFAEVTSREDMVEAYAWSHDHHMPICVLGGGSNTLFPDEGLEALVLIPTLKGITFSGEGGNMWVTAGAGEPWDAFVEATVARGLAGLENLSAIPGTVGGAPIQNIGAYGVEVCNTITEVEVFDPMEGQVHIYPREACGFGYRESIFKHQPHLLVLSVTFELSKNNSIHIGYRDLAEYFSGRDPHTLSVAEVREAVSVIRAKKFPNLSLYGTAGSFFKNPLVSADAIERIRTVCGAEPPQFPQENSLIKVPLAWILDRLGWKGRREGAVGTHEHQPIVLVNYGGATTQEILLFADSIRADIHARIGIEIEYEVRAISLTDCYSPARA